MKLLTEKYNIAEISVLEKRMQKYYEVASTYPAFVTPAYHTQQWKILLKYIKHYSNTNKIVEILEIGAGKSGLGEFLESENVRSCVRVTSQDVTPLNIAWLKRYSDQVFIGDVEKMDGKFHIVIHSYVLEHVSRPLSFLNHVYNKLTFDGGVNIIECPRYDFLFYLPNSMDHLSMIEKIKMKIRLIFFSKPFSIIDDPAIFYLPFRTDRDAIHLVRKKDFYNLFGKSNIRTWRAKSFGFRHWLLNTFLTCRMCIKK